MIDLTWGTDPNEPFWSQISKSWSNSERNRVGNSHSFAFIDHLFIYFTKLKGPRCVCRESIHTIMWVQWHFTELPFFRKPFRHPSLQTPYHIISVGKAILPLYRSYVRVFLIKSIYEISCMCWSLISTSNVNLWVSVNTPLLRKLHIKTLQILVYRYENESSRKRKCSFITYENEASIGEIRNLLQFSVSVEESWI